MNFLRMYHNMSGTIVYWSLMLNIHTLIFIDYFNKKKEKQSLIIIGILI